ncbi:MAG TPA: hypothetical protein VKY25_00105 [Erysipelothrix sp.]|nr:hypothetical protein [Erysipelothrix sp.]
MKRFVILSLIFFVLFIAYQLWNMKILKYIVYILIASIGGVILQEYFTKLSYSRPQRGEDIDKN